MTSTHSTALLAAAVLLCAAPVRADDRGMAGVPQIRVVASHEIEAAPDEVHLMVEAYAEAVQPAEAQRESGKKVQIILSRAKNFGVPENKLRALSTQLQPRYSYPEDPITRERKQKLEGYTASTLVEIRTDKINDYAKLLSDLAEGGIDRIQNVNFALKNSDEVEEKALIEATKEARAKAEKLAAASGATLGRLLYLTEEGGAYMPPPMPMMAKRMVAAEMAMDAGGAASLPGLQTVSKQVTAVFALE